MAKLGSHLFLDLFFTEAFGMRGPCSLALSFQDLLLTVIWKLTTGTRTSSVQLNSTVLMRLLTFALTSMSPWCSRCSRKPCPTQSQPKDLTCHSVNVLNISIRIAQEKWNKLNNSLVNDGIHVLDTEKQWKISGTPRRCWFQRFS